MTEPLTLTVNDGDLYTLVKHIRDNWPQREIVQIRWSINRAHSEDPEAVKSIASHMWKELEDKTRPGIIIQRTTHFRLEGQDTLLLAQTKGVVIVTAKAVVIPPLPDAQ